MQSYEWSVLLQQRMEGGQLWLEFLRAPALSMEFDYG
jgi:hypothetical protein